MKHPLRDRPHAPPFERERQALAPPRHILTEPPSNPEEGETKPLPEAPASQSILTKGGDDANTSPRMRPHEPAGLTIAQQELSVRPCWPSIGQRREGAGPQRRPVDTASASGCHGDAGAAAPPWPGRSPGPRCDQRRQIRSAPHRSGCSPGGQRGCCEPLSCCGTGLKVWQS